MQFLIRIKKKLLKNKLNKNDSVKIIAGSANTKYQGWVSTNIDELNIINEDDFKYYFETKLVDNILLEHVVEHLEYKDFIKFLNIAKKYLKKGGVVRIAVPDANHPSQYVKELTGVNGTEPGADDHKFFYAISDFEKIASQLGYKINKLEYFDEDGQFKMSNYDFQNGYISRCSKNYKGRFINNKKEYNKMIDTVPENLKDQFSKYKISYTSLLVDFVND